MRQQNNSGIVIIFFLYRKYMLLFFVVSFHSTAVLKISQNLVNTEQSSKLFFIVLKIYVAIFCRIILFEDSCFEDFAKFC